MTCGRPACERLQHNEACQAWRERNREASRHHYRDVVEPFRRRQPTYQRRWRLGRRLAEIREQLCRLPEVAMAQLKAAAERARVLVNEGEEATQSGVITRDSVPMIVAAVDEVTSALAQLARGRAKLEALGF